jgi:hemerythrin superfamily protein
MDAIAVLKADHQAVEDRFKKFETLGARAKKSKAAIVTEVIKALSVHAVIEEQVFYPAVREKMSDDNDMVLEALKEHHVVKWTLSELDFMSPDEERFDAKFRVLAESVRRHVEEEEHELFPKVRKGFTRSELHDLGDALATAKKTVPTPHPRTADEPPLNALAAAAIAPVDAGEAAVRKVRSVVTGG